MKILVAPNAMKGTLTASDFAEAVKEGVLNVHPNALVQCMPMADGGDGTAEVLSKHFGAKLVELKVLDPLKRTITASYGLTPDGTAIIEMASASGMALLSHEELNPMKAGSWGTGQLMVDALERGVQKIILCVGGTATVDAGLGALVALGAKCWNQKGELLNGCGADLAHATGFDVSLVRERFNNTDLTIITDVDHKLLGPQGAVSVFAPQKGATEQQMGQLEKGMSIFCGLLLQTTGQDVSDRACMGAAGGIAASFSAIVEANICLGAAFIADALGLDEAIERSDVVVTGEGRFDDQTAGQKAPYVVAQRAKERKRHTICICGVSDVDKSNYFDELYQLLSADIDLNFAKENAYELIVQKSSSIFTILSAENRDQ